MIGAIEKLVQQTADVLKQHGLKLTTAESCTGGGLSYWMTSISGSSEWFDRGFVTYSDLSKTQLLGVKAETIASCGAVSEETAREMAEGALTNSAADISIAITGIAGPTGGSVEKPVGTVWIALAKHNIPTQAQVDVFSGNRQEIRLRVIIRSLEMLLNLF